MSEYEIVALLNSFRSDQVVLIGQMISLHLAMVVGIYYFLHRSGLAMKSAIFVLYSVGYATLLGLLYNLSLQIVGARSDLIALTERGERLSGVGYAAFRQTEAAFTNWVSVLANISFVALWFGTLFFLFFWKRPKEIA
jgi:hypothetical protein